MFDIVAKINRNLETLLERISIRRFLIALFLILISLSVIIFALFSYKTIYNTIYQERVIKLRYIDDLVINVLKYQDSLVKSKQKTLKEAQSDAIDIVKSMNLRNKDYIWIDEYNGKSIYHPMPDYSKKDYVDNKIREIVDRYNEGYVNYKWVKLSANRRLEFRKISYVKGFKNWNWIVGTGVYINDINLTVIRALLKGLIPLSCALIVMISILNIIIFKSMVKPINELAKTSHKLAEYDLDVTLPTSESNTELGNLYKIVNKFVSLFEKERKTAKREIVLRNIIDKIRSSLDVEDILYFICEETAQLFNVQRASIGSFSQSEGSETYFHRREYKSSPMIVSFTENPKSIEVSNYWKTKLSTDKEVLAIDNIEESDAPEYFKEIYKEIGVKSIIGIPIQKGDVLWGILVLSEYNKTKHWSHEDKELLKTIADQVYIAINQAELYEKEKKTSEREKIIREIIAKIRSSLDYEDTLRYICEEIAKIFNVQRVTIVTLPTSDDLTIFTVKQEYKISPEIKGLSNVPNFSKASEYWWRSLSANSIVGIDDFYDSNASDEFNKAYISIGAKAVIAVAIKNEEKMWGSLVLTEYYKNRRWSEEEKSLLLTLSDQIYLAIHQSELYKQEQETAETEKFNRRILEILRNTLDKDTIIHLFVRNIGQYFNADRVFFVEYDENKKRYIPYEKNSEYLSDPSKKSFAGFDWSSSSVKDYINPLLEKREFKMFCIKEYPHEKIKQDSFLYHFKDSNVKSSYSFPVVYEGKLKGFFCIEFTDSDCVHLSDEDIIRIRSLCTHAGIALYNSELFVHAQNAVKFKEMFVKNLSAEIYEMLDAVNALSEIMKETDSKCYESFISYIDKINQSAKKLLDLASE